MKSYEFLNEAPIDDLEAQYDDQPQQPGVTRQPGVVSKAVSAASRAGSNTLGMLSKGISQGSTLGGVYGVTGGAIRPAAVDSPIVSGPADKIGKDEQQVISYLQQTAGGKNVLPISRSSNQKLNQLLIKAGLMK
jgi:hypothetical protein